MCGCTSSVSNDDHCRCHAAALSTHYVSQHWIAAERCAAPIYGSIAAISEWTFVSAGNKNNNNNIACRRAYMRLLTADVLLSLAARFVSFRFMYKFIRFFFASSSSYFLWIGATTPRIASFATSLRPRRLSYCHLRCCCCCVSCCSFLIFFSLLFSDRVLVFWLRPVP